MSSGDQTEEHIQRLRAGLGEQVCVEFAQILPSEVQLGSWERRLSRLDRVRELVDQTIPPPSLVEVLEEGQRRLESQSAED